MFFMFNRATKLLSSQNEFGAQPEKFNNVVPSCPHDAQNILRMFIGNNSGDLVIPEELRWLETAINEFNELQKTNGISNSFVFVTVRHGDVIHRDDTWHVDGYSVKIPNIPEQNYIMSSNQHTEYAVGDQFKVPADFDGMRHNIHSYLDSKVTEINTCESGWYGIDPFVVHRRPKNCKGQRTFVRITFTPIFIESDENTPNPILPVQKFGVNRTNDLRTKLVDYPN